jgi:uncharacterized protein YcfJ
MSEFRVKHYSVERNATVYKVDPYYNVAVPISKEGKHTYIQKGKIIKSLGEQKRLVLQSREKFDFLVLVNGDAVKMDDVKFIKEDDKCCDGDGSQENTEAKYSESDKDKNKMPEKRPDKSAYLNKSRFDKGMVTGAIVGAVLLGAVLWFTTGGNKVKTMLGIVAGAILGGVIGRFAGRRGEKTISTTEESIEKEVADTSSATSSATSENERGAAKPADKELFLQIGETYLFTLAKPSPLLTYDNGFYIVKDKGKHSFVSGTIKAKIVEANEPAMFVLNQATGKIEKKVINKPLPFLEVGKNLFVPMAFVSPTSIITPEEMKGYAAGAVKLDDEIYVKGRYAGKRWYYLTYTAKV